MTLRARTVFLVSIALVTGLVIANLDNIRLHRARAFSKAARDGSVLKMRILHQLGADVNTTAPGYGSAIVAAAHAGQIGSLRYLLSHGANVNQREKLTTPLAAATYGGQTETVKYLIAEGADVNAVSDGGSPLRIAITQGFPAIATALKESGAKDCYQYQIDDCR
jgi:ankyrin repeat protein